jgi:anti-sigma factor RsiW
VIPGELTCRDLVELSTDYLEAELAPDDRTRVEEHLVICAECARYVGQMVRTVELIGGLRGWSPA